MKSIDIQNMTDRQLNRVLAQFMDYKVVSNDHHQYKIIDGNGNESKYDKYTEEEAWLCAPNYCLDLSASMEVQKKSLELDHVGYMAHLTYMTGHNYHEGLNMDTAKSMLLATPRQRSEAACMTIYVWGEKNED